MALCKTFSDLKDILLEYPDEEFDKVYNPGDAAKRSGVYRCIMCGKEETSIAGNNLPPQSHHSHPKGLGPIKWKLIITTSLRI